MVRVGCLLLRENLAEIDQPPSETPISNQCSIVLRLSLGWKVYVASKPKPPKGGLINAKSPKFEQ